MRDSVQSSARDQDPRVDIKVNAHQHLVYKASSARNRYPICKSVLYAEPHTVTTILHVSLLIGLSNTHGHFKCFHERSCLTIKFPLMRSRPMTSRFSCPMMEHMSSVLGVPMQSSYVPGVMFSDGYSDRMSYFERVGNLLETNVNYLAFRKIRDMETSMFRKHFG